MVDSTPTRAKKCISPRLIKSQFDIGHLTRLNVYSIHPHLANCKSMDNVIGCETQMKRLADFCLNNVWTPAAVFCHLGVDEGGARPKEKWRSNRPQSCYRYQNAREEFQAFHNNNQSIARVRIKQYAITGIDETRASRAAFCPVRADQIKPTTSASVCPGASMEVSRGCHAASAVPKRFQPRPSGSESDARIYVAFVSTNDKLNATQNIKPRGTSEVESGAKRFLKVLRLSNRDTQRAKRAGKII